MSNSSNNGSGNDDRQLTICDVLERAQRENGGHHSARATTSSTIAPDQIKQILRHLVQTAHANSAAKGFWGSEEIIDLRAAVVDPHDDLDQELRTHVLLGKLMLIDTEVAEVAEVVRTGNLEMTLRADGKPEGALAELADVLIRVLDLVQPLEELVHEDFGEAVLLKMAYNRTRPVRHGKRA